MTRKDMEPAGVGGGLASRSPTQMSKPATSTITARADGFGGKGWLRTGDYFDLDDDGFGFSSTTDTIVWSSRPPGNSFNADHYATDDGPGADVSEATSELAAAVIRLEGEMREAVTAELTWTRPDGVTAWNGTASIPDPSTEDCDGNPCEWWESVYFYTFIGRDFGQGGTAEVVGPGTYTVEFDTNYGTYTDTVRMIGPETTSCSVPNKIGPNSSATATVTVEKPDNNAYSGTVYVAEDMTDQKTDRSALVLGSSSFAIGSSESSTSVNVSVSTTGYSRSDEIDVVTYCVV